MSVMVAPPGLSNVVVADTAIGDVRGDEGFYQYRQYSAIDLARTKTFEEVWFLFVYGRCLRDYVPCCRRLRQPHRLYRCGMRVQIRGLPTRWPPRR